MTVLEHTNCDVLSNEKMINNTVALNYVQNFDKVRDNLNLECVEKERFVFSMAINCKQMDWGECS